MTIDLTAIVSAVLTLLGALIVRYVIPWIKSKTTAEQQAAINNWVAIAVQAAEMIYDGPAKGAEKKQYVLNYLATRGITLDSTVLDALIEAAVWELKNGAL